MLALCRYVSFGGDEPHEEPHARPRTGALEAILGWGLYLGPVNRRIMYKPLLG